MKQANLAKRLVLTTAAIVIMVLALAMLRRGDRDTPAPVAATSAQKPGQSVVPSSPKMMRQRMSVIRGDLALKNQELARLRAKAHAENDEIKALQASFELEHAALRATVKALPQVAEAESARAAVQKQIVAFSSERTALITEIKQDSAIAAEAGQCATCVKLGRKHSGAPKHDPSEHVTALRKRIEGVDAKLTGLRKELRVATDQVTSAKEEVRTANPEIKQQTARLQERKYEIVGQINQIPEVNTVRLPHRALERELMTLEHALRAATADKSKQKSATDTASSREQSNG
jgi:chromosome segregation ATPase